MTLAYFDCFAGAAGDMIIAALLDAGADVDALRRELAKLPLGDCGFTTEKVNRKGICGTTFRVDDSRLNEHSHRHLADILHLIDGASLPPGAADRAKRIFTRLGEAEARVHGVSLEEVHFHEVGAVDSILDIVGAAVALDLLGVHFVACSPVPLGHGVVECDHGRLPVPTPATVELLKGAPTVPGEADGEMTTPTGAAILTTLAKEYGPPPDMLLTAVGYGAGTRDTGPLPNLLRVLIGETGREGAADSVVELSANVDDCTGEVLGATIDMLLAAGCLDAWAAPITMKKSRPAWMISALCIERDAAEAERILFVETTTFGVRRRRCERSKLRRSFETVETVYGPIRMKAGRLGEQVVTASPEFADCAAASEAHHVPIKEVLAAAQAAYRAGTRSKEADEQG